MKRLLPNSVALLLLLSSASVYCSAAAAAGMLRSNGGVSVNGSAVSTVTTVFAGDRIETAPKAGGNVTVGSSSVLLNENSSLLFNGQSMDFQCGGGTIQTSQGLAARYGRTTVKPVKDSARYRVQQTGASVQISALDGDLSLTDGSREFTVEAGKSANLAYTGCTTQMAKNEVQDVAAKSAGTPLTSDSPMTGVGTQTGSLNNALIVGPAAVTGVAILGIIEVRQNPASPSRP
jgi:hypothetical protein